MRLQQLSLFHRETTSLQFGARQRGEHNSRKDADGVYYDSVKTTQEIIRQRDSHPEGDGPARDDVAKQAIAKDRIRNDRTENPILPKKDPLTQEQEEILENRQAGP